MNDSAIKALLGFGFRLEAFIEMLLGGFSIVAIPSELIAAVSLLASAPSVLADAPAALTQWIALSDADAADIEAYVQENYGSTPSGVDADIEQVLNFLVSLHSVVAWFAGKLAKPAAPVVA